MYSFKSKNLKYRDLKFPSLNICALGKLFTATSYPFFYWLVGGMNMLASAAQVTFRIEILV